MAIPQHDKIRLVLNASLPKGGSFNKNMDDKGPEKISMTSASLFSYEILKAGRGAIMTKFDMTDAYKNVPCKTEDLRLQGVFMGRKILCRNQNDFWGKKLGSQF